MNSHLHGLEIMEALGIVRITCTLISNVIILCSSIILIQFQNTIECIINSFLATFAPLLRPIKYQFLRLLCTVSRHCDTGHPELIFVLRSVVRTIRHDSCSCRYQIICLGSNHKLSCRLLRPLGYCIRLEHRYLLGTIQTIIPV